jgi:NAD(P)-dependent dehydrogenase (short-subunit alcohol dehydrogenase family)
MTDKLFSVQDKIVVITGGLGQLGRQFTAALAQRGARVAIFDVRGGEKCATELCRELDIDCDAVLLLPVDVGRRGSIEAALASVKAEWGVPDALINNAALDSPPDAAAAANGPFESYPEDLWDEVMRVNVKGVFLTSQIVGGEMAHAGRGAIVNIGSIYGLVSPDQRIYEYRRREGAQFFKPAAYAVSKSALLNLLSSFPMPLSAGKTSTISSSILWRKLRRES